MRKLTTSIAIVLTLACSYVCANYLREYKEQKAAGKAEAYLKTEVIAGNASDPSFNTLAGCMYWASKTYQVPVTVLMSIRNVEGGRIGQSVPNTNGTRDLGPMQINSIWVSQLAQQWHVNYATAYQAIRDNGCENVYIGAWILKQKIKQTGTLYNGIAYYHSATPRPGAVYANKVVMVMQRKGLSPR
jgi:soluble lytic murein transglycosylase-like protein